MRQTLPRCWKARALEAESPCAATNARAKMAGSFLGARPLSLTSTIRFTARTPSAWMQRISASWFQIGVTNRIRTGTNAFTGRDAACYIMITIHWSPGSDSHRRIRVYETRPVAAEARGL